MKHLSTASLFAIAFLVATTLFSCKKDNTCDCISSVHRNGIPGTTDYYTYNIYGTKQNAEAKCTKNNHDGTSLTLHCELK